MSKFPKRYVMPNGAVYLVTLENVRGDYAATVAQFDDLPDEEKARQIRDFDEEHAEQWMADQWYGGEIVTWGKATGDICEETREAWIAHGISAAVDVWASEFEVDTK